MLEPANINIFTLRNTRCPFYFRSAPRLGALFHSALAIQYTPVRRLIARLMRSRTDDDDPLAAALTPPQDETPEARAIRLSREEEARRVSQAIDESIRTERQLNKKHKIVRILLLGQSESGAPPYLRFASLAFSIAYTPRLQASLRRCAVSDVLSCVRAPFVTLPYYAEFQRVYTPTAFREERIHWRVIIQLNVIRSVHTILAAISAHHRQTSRLRAYSSSEARWDSRSQVPSFRTDGRGKGKARADTFSEFGDDDDDDGRHRDAAVRYPDAYSEDDSREDAELDEIAQRLQPLRPIEAMLKERLVPPSEDEPADLGAGPHTSALGHVKEVFVRPGRWYSGGAGARPASAICAEVADEAQQVLYELRFDLMRLWTSTRAREILALRRVRPEEESGL